MFNDFQTHLTSSAKRCCELWEKNMSKKFEEKCLELNAIEEKMKSTPVFNIDRKYMNKFKARDLRTTVRLGRPRSQPFGPYIPV